MSRATHLKIKIKTLAYEARIIRKEERKHLQLARCLKVVEPLEVKLMTKHYRAFWDLSEHRKGKVRHAARENGLAYGFIRGRSYAQMEAKCRPDNRPDFKSIEKIARRFGALEHKERWADWLASAEAHLAGVKEAA